ncbi:TolC family protein [Roseimaritima sediminicola]|uniref:TolC family protein n=1 Tax=Roseimaritima sediminicola TaxID=2662066 RepID=UPI001386DC5F|nr:TolC family protein [Roseimaritima sediminicola]
MAGPTAKATRTTALLLVLAVASLAAGQSPQWWHGAIQKPLGIAPSAQPITADDATAQALAQSPEVRRIELAPMIARTEITRQRAAFDWNNFLETNWANRSDPIGSILTTGDLSGRFEDDLLTGGAGVRKQTTSGAQWELAQRSGWQRNNSTYLIPNPQSTSRLELTVTQPLLRGRGRQVNYFRVLEAQLQTEVLQADAVARMQEHVLQVGTAYWDLYRTRCSFLIRRQAAQRADQLVQSLDQRRSVDATARQILRAQTAAARRRAALMTIASEADRTATRLRRLMGRTDYAIELVPTQLPLQDSPTYDRQAAVQLALSNRPEVSKAVREVRTASLRVGVSRNALLPQLDLIAGSYVAGLASNRNVFPAYGNQFVDGRPSVNLGLLWQRPVGNRAARSLVHQRELELQEAMAGYEAALQAARADVELALVRLNVTYQTIDQRTHSLAAADRELRYLQDRWQTAPGAGGSAILLLEDLIEAQGRLADEEVALATAEAEFNIAILQLHQALGTLLRPAALACPPWQSESAALLDASDQGMDAQNEGMTVEGMTAETLPPPVRLDQPEVAP